jgi:hypothetical protein
LFSDGEMPRRRSDSRKGSAPLRYNSRFESSRKNKNIMEAERINAIGNKIADLAQRGDELRRYL